MNHCPQEDTSSIPSLAKALSGSESNHFNPESSHFRLEEDHEAQHFEFQALCAKVEDLDIAPEDALAQA